MKNIKKQMTKEEVEHLEKHLIDLQENYDYLSDNPDEIENGWNYASSLFNYVGLSSGSGCLTQIRCGAKSASVAELTILIKDDERIPLSVENIKDHHLDAFLEWQKDHRVLKAQGYIPSHVIL